MLQSPTSIQQHIHAHFHYAPGTQQYLRFDVIRQHKRSSTLIAFNWFVLGLWHMQHKIELVTFCETMISFENTVYRLSKNHIIWIFCVNLLGSIRTNTHTKNWLAIYFNKKHIRNGSCFLQHIRAIIIIAVIMMRIVMGSQPCVKMKHIKMLITCTMSDLSWQRAGKRTTVTVAQHEHKRISSAIKLVARVKLTSFKDHSRTTFVQNLNLFPHTAVSSGFGRDYRITPEEKATLSIEPHIHIFDAAGRSEVVAAAKVKLWPMPSNVIH